MTQQILVPSLQLSQCIEIARVRELPILGEVLVTEGQIVDSTTPIAQALMPGNLMIVRASQQLGIEAHELRDCLHYKEGDAVQESAILAEHSGLFGFFRSEVKSPYTGTIEFISEHTGHIGIRLPSTVHVVTSYLKGRVKSIIPQKGAVVSSVAALAQAVFGVGGERTGRLKAIKASCQDTVRLSAIPDNIEGAILFGGASVTSGALQLAAERGAIGFIVGSIDDVVLRAYLGFEIGVAVTGQEKVPMTLLISEGFGHISMNENFFNLLKKYEGIEASINGTTQVRAGAVRPEVLVFHEETLSNAQLKDASLSVGSRVRCIRHPYLGLFGTIVSLPSELVRIETGTLTRVLSARLDSAGEVLVPRANVELV